MRIGSRLVIIQFIYDKTDIIIRGSGNVISEQRPVSDVTSVSLATIGDLTIEIGDRESFRIEADDNLLEYFETEVRNGELSIRMQPEVNVDPSGPVRYFLTARRIDAISISSSGDVHAPDLTADRFKIRLSSSGDLQMGDLDAQSLSVGISSSGRVVMGTLKASTLEVNMSSAGDLPIAGGRVDDQDVDISSSGDYVAESLASTNAKVRLTSSGSATIRVGETLQASLSSSGNLSYYGDPTVDVYTSSSGDVIRLGD